MVYKKEHYWAKSITSILTRQDMFFLEQCKEFFSLKVFFSSVNSKSLSWCIVKKSKPEF